MDDQERGPFGAALRRLREQAGVSQENLARPMQRTRQAVSQWERGKELPDKNDVGKLDTALNTGGELLTLWQRARLAQRAKDDGTDLEGVIATDRRQAMTAALGAAAAAELSRRIARADPDPLSLDRYEAHVHRVAAAYRTTSHEQMVAQVGPKWRNVEDLLDTRISPKVRAQLTAVAGWYAFYLGTLGFDMGDDDAAIGYLRLADQHAAEADELLPAKSPLRSDVHLLSGSTAAMRSSVAYFTRAYAQAADIARQAREGAHPYTRPLLAGCEARAAALAGRPDDAREALADMQDHVWQGDVMPGPNPGDPAFMHSFMAVTLTHLGDGVAAEQHAQVGLDLEIASGPDHFVQISGTYNALGQALLRRDDPDPERAADAAMRALDAVADRSHPRTVERAGQMWRTLDSRWPAVPAVRELGQRLRETRSLPGGTSV